MQPSIDSKPSRDAMKTHGMKGAFFCTFSSKKATAQLLPNNYTQSISEKFTRCSFTGKERDEETGYGYFGARYMDHELMTMWLSVDPLADKYPSLSPYSYCAWNPVKLVDPDGCKIHLYDDLTVEKIKKYMRDLFGDDKMFSYENESMTIKEREFNKFYKKASPDQQALLDGLKILIERSELATVKVQEDDIKFVFEHRDCDGSMRGDCISGYTSDKPVKCMGYLIAINDRGIDQQVTYSTGLYCLGGVGMDRLYPLLTTTTAASTFIHETLDELLNRTLLGNVTRESEGKEKLKYQNIAQRILNRLERDGNDHQY